MKAYGFMINGRGSGNGYDRKISPGDEVGKCKHHVASIKNALRAHKKAARRAGKEELGEDIRYGKDNAEVR